MSLIFLKMSAQIIKCLNSGVCIFMSLSAYPSILLSPLPPPSLLCSNKIKCTNKQTHAYKHKLMSNSKLCIKKKKKKITCGHLANKQP